MEELSSENAAEFNAERINEINGGEPLNPINVEGADALLSDHATQPNLDSITTKSYYEEANKESGNSIPISVIMPELIDIQVREINEALMTNGQNPNGSEIPTTAAIKVFNSPT